MNEKRVTKQKSKKRKQDCSNSVDLRSLRDAEYTQSHRPVTHTLRALGPDVPTTALFELLVAVIGLGGGGRSLGM